MNFKTNIRIPQAGLILLMEIFAVAALFGSPTRPASTGQTLGTMDWKFWRFEHLKTLDPWGDADGDARDIVAVYVKEEIETFYFRIDLMDLRRDSTANVYFAVDFQAGGKTDLMQGNQDLVADIAWDVLFVWRETNNLSVFDTTFADHPEYLGNAAIDNQLDFIEFSLRKSAFPGWDGTPFQVQVFTTKNDVASISDKTAPVATDASTGRAKLVLAFGNMFNASGPHSIGWYDGYALSAEMRPGERRGMRYILDAVEKYKLPLSITTMQVNYLPGDDYLPMNDRLRDLANKGQLELPETLTYGYFMPWQPDDVDQTAIRMAREYRQAFGFGQSEIFGPYETMLTAGDLAIIKEAGYTAIPAFSDNIGNWFGWIEDWSDQEKTRAWFESLKKIHLVNGIKLLVSGQGILWEPRWGEINGHLLDSERLTGTDQGMHQWWRRFLLDMALDPDQEKYCSLGTDILLTPWLFQDITEWNARWLASHPWIEVTTYTDLLQRNWTPIDHGDLGLAPDQLLDRYPSEGDMHYNTYFSQFYYGGIADGHSPLVAAGDTIESYFDYVPFLRGGQPIPSGKKMGDDKTPGTIVYETLQNLRAAPDNELTRLAWLAYFMNIGEQTFHAQYNYQSGELPKDDWGGKYLHPAAKVRANYLRQVNKIVAAAHWAEEAAQGTLPDSAQLLGRDLDLDGEEEYIFKSNKILTIFENDGGRLEFAFAYDPSVGPVELVGPAWQFYVPFKTDYAEGELPFLQFMESAFEDENYASAVFAAEMNNGRLIFTSPDGGMQKTFILNDATIYAHYEVNNSENIYVHFGLPGNLASFYSRNWWENITEISTPDAVGWQRANGGYAVVNLLNTRLGSADSFIDSPVRTELKERDDTSTYPNGHWLYFPYNNAWVTANSQFDVSLTLSAKLPTIVEQFTEALPGQFVVRQNYPNPFNPATVIEYQLPQAMQVEIAIFNLRGQKIATLEKGFQTAGRHQITWDGTDDSGRRLAGGVFFYQVKAGDVVHVSKMIMLR